MMLKITGIDRIIKISINLNDLCKFYNVLDDIIIECTKTENRDITKALGNLKPFHEELKRVIDSSADY